MQKWGNSRLPSSDSEILSEKQTLFIHGLDALYVKFEPGYMSCGPTEANPDPAAGVLALQRLVLLLKLTLPAAQCQSDIANVES